MNDSKKYYETNASAFYAMTATVDMSPLRAKFLAHVPPDGHILDAGCGSGRDAKAFADLGFRVTAFDASEALAQLATSHCGFSVQVRTFDDVDEIEVYDGIWCCASLLHVPAPDMPRSLRALWDALKPGGALYVSFKNGEGTREKDGRTFTDADEGRVRAWLRHVSNAEVIDVWQTKDARPERPDEWTNAIAVKSSVPRRKLVTGGSDPFLPHLSKAVSGATDIAIAVSFVKTTGLRLLMKDLESALRSGGESAREAARLRFLTSDYLGITDPEALRMLSLLQQHGAEVRVFVTDNDSFHLKAYIFAQRPPDGSVRGTAFVGSSNISGQALQEALEWNYRVVYPGDDGFLEAERRFEELFAHHRCVPLTDAWIDAYEKRRRPPPVAVAPGSDELEPPPQPTPVQTDALEALEATRGEGFRRGLVVLATGLGKTWLAAFDAERMGARRVLFVAHREEILGQAAETFLRIRKGRRVGFYTGKARDGEVDVLCASVQTLSRAAHLEKFSPQHFDYVVVDEFHHASAATYRKLLGHFAPSFLLGLTATPHRTDQSDILSFCDDNLVFTCGLFDGIEQELLAPFHYYGILDEEVDYREIPWRNGKFDPEQLSNKLATLGRARHALKEWRERSQRRTLAFCVSTRHADFMAEQFRRAGVEAAAVYSGSQLGRAEALTRLREGQLQVIFSVDFFNEGVDLPSIDTVMMLRPTESKILFVQQLGRGLRRSEGKSHLVVLDFIGNHQSFLQKPPALFGVGGTYKDLAAFARAAESNRLPLPDGCYVNYDLRIIELLKSLDRQGTSNEYQALRATRGRRPTLAEFYRSGASVQAMRQQYGSWFDLVKEQGDLAADEGACLENARSLLKEIETTQMTKSFKMILLEALLELDGFRNPPTLPALAERSWNVLHRRPALVSDLAPGVRPLADGRGLQWQRYWQDNPVNAWTGGNLADASKALFQVTSGRFDLAKPLPADQVDALSSMAGELAGYRLASYEARQGAAHPASNVLPFPARNATVLPYFPNLKIACGHFRTGKTDSDEHVSLPASYGQLDSHRHFIARASGNSMDGGKHPVRDGDYLLLELLSPTSAGGITGAVVAIERQDESGDNQYLLRNVAKNARGEYVLKANNATYADMIANEEMRTLARLKSIVDPLDLQIGRAFKREEVPALFGEEFNPGNWNVGHVVLSAKKAHVLFVTLNKQGKAEEHRYHDYWVDANRLHWQSQNSTGPDTKKGRQLIEHARTGINLHLFVRERKLAGSKGAPFVYFGRARYESHIGSHPMGVVLFVG
jgi:superfamily II DNA or RNA helicase/HKD family nuclease/2-polyprenyl-3-methyl-5-hydroxy-6-metoxy-1,4-benzoquinol methylase